MESYGNKLEENVARYVQQKSTRTAADDQQRALLLIQNANLSADSPNALTIQLTTMDYMHKQRTNAESYNRNANEITALQNVQIDEDASTEKIIEKLSEIIAN